MSNQPITSHFRTCNLCEAMCGIEIQHNGNEILSIKGDAEDPFSRGHICPKAIALQDIYNDPDRLTFPVKKTGSGWQRISWAEAYETVVNRIVAIQEKHGNNALGVYVGNPNVHNMGSILYLPPFIRSLRTRNRFSATSVDQLPHQFAAYYMFGHQLLMPVPDVDRTRYMLMFGANPLASNGSIMTAPDIKNRLKAIQKRGGKLIVIDPRRSETADIANEHIFIKPGKDVLLILALIHCVIAEDQIDTGHLNDSIDGLEKIKELVKPFSPEAVQSASGIPAETTRRIAREFCQSESSVCYGRMGVSTQAFGGLAQWLINVLNIITGNFDSPGGAMFTTPAFDVVGLTNLTGQNGSHGRWKSRVRGLPEFGGELPVSTMAEEILTEGDGQIKAMVTVAGNPVLSTPNGTLLDKAFSGLEFMVAVDIYINETTRHADIILPPATGLETPHYDVVFHYLAVRNTAKYSPALFEPEAGMKYDWEILRELREKFETTDERRRSRIPLKLDFFKRLPPNKILDLAVRFGPYGAWGVPAIDGRNLNLNTLKRLPHGTDLGALQSIFPGRLPSSKIQLAPEPMLKDLPRVQRQLKVSSAQEELVLIGRRHLRSNNSWMHNSERLVRGKNRCTLIIHPEDAALYNISNGQQISVSSRVGTIFIEAEISDEIMPGVVSIPHGWGHNRDGIRLSTASQYAGVSINDLTDETELDELTGNAILNGVPVTLERTKH